MKQVLERLFPSLRRKIAFAVFLGMLIAGVAFVYVAHRTGYTMLQQQAQMKAQGIAAILIDRLEQTMVEEGGNHVKQVLLSVTTSPDIVNTYLLKRDGTVSFQAKDEEGYSHIPIDQFLPVSGRRGDRFMTVRENERLFEYIAIPVLKKPGCTNCHTEEDSLRGYFTVKLALDDVRAAAIEHRTTNILMTAITFFSLGGIIYFSISLLIIKPVATLHAHIRRVEEGIAKMESGERTVFPLLPEPKTNDEIADLSRDVNKLVRRLNEGNAKLIEMHQLQLEQAAKLASVGEMAASMAHEIKNPIAGVLGAVQVFDAEVEQDDPRKEIYSEMKVQLERVNHAVTDLLSFARPTPPQFESVEMNDVIRRTHTMLAKQIKEQHIEVNMELADTASLIEADKKQIQQVIWNVMLNAVQAMEHSGLLTVSSSRKNGSVFLKISDTGKGIPRECMNEVFKPFFTTKHKGTGLGMTITKRIIEQHRGTVSLESEPGKGTEVLINLPLKQEVA